MSRNTLSPILPASLIAVILIAVIVTSGCMSPAGVPVTGEIKKFSSPAEIRQYIADNTALANAAEYETTGLTVFSESGPGAPQRTTADSAKTVAVSLPVAGSVDYSQTNVQVAGVDEPDFVKNDERYIYVISGTTLTIVDAYPAATAKIVSTTEIDDTPKDLFVTGDRLVLFTVGTDTLTRDDSPVSSSQAKMMMPPIRSYTPVTHAIFYDTSDKLHPKVIKDYTIDGDFADARLIGSTLYLVTREQVYTYDRDEITVPALREGVKTVVVPDVWYFDNPERQYTFTTISSFDTNSGDEKDAQTYLVGSGNVMYVSPDAMYITYQKFHRVASPVRGGGVITDITSPVGFAAGSSGAPANTVPQDFNTMSDAEREAVIAGLKTSEQELAVKGEVSQGTTAIHKIAIRDGTITYNARGEVPGYVKNQFALDEYGGNLRVATTSDVWTRSGQYEYNSVFVLDPKMKTIGALTHIAPQEKIYSTRFVGDRLYMVTFKRIDPFFVIDLSSPENPKILGKLKIPGYSDYLHPYDKNHIIGIGKETGTNDWGGVSTKGLKLALFDVTDVEHPKQLDKVEIGDAGTDSAALSDHKAFFFDRDRNLLVIPARVVTQWQSQIAQSPGDLQIWYGAYVFGVAPDTGFTLKGTVEHGTGGNRYYWYGSSASEVKRSLSIDNILYTLSAKQILANSLDNVNTSLARIPLGNEDILYPVIKGE
jgi:inhibitor of cysteine peptidase